MGGYGTESPGATMDTGYMSDSLPPTAPAPIIMSQPYFGGGQGVSTPFGAPLSNPGIAFPQPTAQSGFTASFGGAGAGTGIPFGGGGLSSFTATPTAAGNGNSGAFVFGSAASGAPFGTHVMSAAAPQSAAPPAFAPFGSGATLGVGNSPVLGPTPTNGSGAFMFGGGGGGAATSGGSSAFSVKVSGAPAGGAAPGGSGFSIGNVSSQSQKSAQTAGRRIVRAKRP